MEREDVDHAHEALEVGHQTRAVVARTRLGNERIVDEHFRLEAAQARRDAGPDLAEPHDADGLAEEL